MQNEPASVAASEHIIERTGSLDDLVVAELAAAAGQAERERDLLLAKKLAELDRREAFHELRLQQLEQNVRERLASLRDGEKGERGEKGEKGEAIKGDPGPTGETGPQGDSIKGEKGEPGEPGQKGDKGETGQRGETGAPGSDGERGETGTPGRDGIDGSNGERGEPGERGADGGDGIDGRSFVIRDTYDPSETYHALDVVTLNATWFVARSDDPGVCPGPGWKAGPTARRGEKGERGERGPRGEIPNIVTSEFPRIVEWDIRAKTYEAFPLMSDGTLGPPIPLRALFEQFQAES
jgi:hypothetical protein